MAPKDTTRDKPLAEGIGVEEGTIEYTDDGTTSVWGAMKTWPYASLWALASTTPMTLVAYSPSWISMLFALPAFTSRVGYAYDGVYVVPARWQSGISAAAMIGQFIGAFLIPVFMDKYGRKLSFLGALACSAAAIFAQFFANNLTTTLVGGLLSGITFGFYSILAITYALEVAPYQLQNFFSATYSTGFVLGPFLAAAISSGVADVQSEWSYRIGYAIQWIWPAVLFPLFLFSPESPTWLIREGRVEEAANALHRLAVIGHDIRPTLILIEQTDRHEREIEKSSSYTEITQGINRRRTLIATVVYTSVVVTGSVLATMLSYFMTIARVDATSSFNMTMGCSGAALLGSFVGIWLVTRVGHRNMYISSLAASTVLFLAVGGLQCAPDYYSRSEIVWAQAGVMTVFMFIWGSGICPFATAIMSGVSSMRLRSRTIAVASAAQFATVILVQIVQTYLLNPDEAALQGYIGFIQGGFNLLLTVWVYLYTPDLSRTPAELDMLFERRVSARHFASYGCSLPGPA
ncbi:hypothetical protein BJX62DRAFT_241433 [Aspergillus germanicus]